MLLISEDFIDIFGFLFTGLTFAGNDLQRVGIIRWLFKFWALSENVTHLLLFFFWWDRDSFLHLVDDFNDVDFMFRFFELSLLSSAFLFGCSFFL